MNTQELAAQIEELYETFRLEHSKSSKLAHSRARKSLSNISKLIKEYRRESIIEDK